MKYKIKFNRVIAVACCSVFLLSSTGCRGKAAQRFLQFLKEESILKECMQGIIEYYIKKDKNYINFPQ